MAGVVKQGGNRFAVLDEEVSEVVPKQVQPKKQAQPKAQTENRPQTAAPKKQSAAEMASGDFEVVGLKDKPTRGGRGGFRGQNRGPRPQPGEEGYRPRPQPGEEGYRAPRPRFGEEGYKPRPKPGEEGYRPRPQPGEEGYRPRLQPGDEGYVKRERKEGEEGGYRGRGDRRPRTEGGRGRAYRPKTTEGEEAPLVEVDNTEVVLNSKHTVDHKGKREGYAGKKRQTDHPYDRRSGTGRGRDVAKGGHGKGNWGNVNSEGRAKEHQEASATGEETKVAEGTEIVQKEGEEIPTDLVKAPVEAETTEEVVEEEETNPNALTLEEYLANKKKTHFKKEARKPEENKKAQLEKNTEVKNKVNTIDSQIKNSATYNAGVTKDTTSNLLGFQGGADEFIPSATSSTRGRGGPRGGRGGPRGAKREGGDRPREPRAARGNKQDLKISEESYPAL